jgi:hypothetical protein
MSNKSCKSRVMVKCEICITFMLSRSYNINSPSLLIRICMSVTPILYLTIISSHIQNSRNTTTSYLWILTYMYSFQVRRIIDFYMTNSRVDIELIEWSKLPKTENSNEQDPNFYWYRLEAFMAIFDCMHRARLVRFYLS